MEMIGGVLLAALLAGPPACGGGEGRICLEDDRFEVSLTWDSEGARFGPRSEETSGTAVPTGYASDTATFHLANDERIDAVVRVLDGCSFNARYWVFAGVASDVGYTLTVTDTDTAESRVYASPTGGVAGSVLDTVAFATCSARRSDLSGPLAASSNGGLACGGGASEACLAGDRFRVALEAEGFGPEATATGMPARETDESVAFFLFDADSIEVLVSVVARPDGTFRYQGANLTNLRTVTTVTDTVTARSTRFETPLGVAAGVLAGAPVEFAFPDAPKAVLGQPLELRIDVFNPNTVDVTVDVTAQLSEALEDPEWACRDEAAVTCTTDPTAGLPDDTLTIAGRATGRLLVRGTVPGFLGAATIRVETSALEGPGVLNENERRVDAAVELDVAVDSILASSFEAGEGG